MHQAKEYLMHTQISVASSLAVYMSMRRRTSVQKASIQLKEGCICIAVMHKEIIDQ